MSSRLCISCVNTRVSLIGFDLERRVPFWFCPANVLRACGVCYDGEALWAASDRQLTRIDGKGLSFVALPGPYPNYAHSIHRIDDGLFAVADTGNSRVLLFDGSLFPLALSPIEEWGEAVPLDAIHVNDMLPFADGFLVSAFSHQPFSRLKKKNLPWAKWKLGTLFYLSREHETTIARIAASGIACPHSLTRFRDDIFCCSSASGDFLHFVRERDYSLRLSECIHVTDTHFVRGALRLSDMWVLGGSCPRHKSEGGGMALYLVHDGGEIEQIVLDITGEIYDILPWEPAMVAISETLLKAPSLSPGNGIAEDVLSGDFPPRCACPEEYR